jgi:signal peptidase II
MADAPQPPGGASTGATVAGAVGQLRWLWLTAALIGLDQWTKWLVSSSFSLYEVRPVLPVFNLTLAHNNGVAFSAFDHDGDWQRWAFSALAAVVAGVLVNWLRTLPRAAHLVAVALSCVLAGALGNMIDRLRFGYVVDFIQWHWDEHYFPSFNVADSAITVGAVLLILESLFSGRDGGTR